MQNAEMIHENKNAKIKISIKPIAFLRGAQVKNRIMLFSGITPVNMLWSQIGSRWLPGVGYTGGAGLFYLMSGAPQTGRGAGARGIRDPIIARQLHNWINEFNISLFFQQNRDSRIPGAQIAARQHPTSEAGPQTLQPDRERKPRFAADMETGIVGSHIVKAKTGGQIKPFTPPKIPGEKRVLLLHPSKDSAVTDRRAIGHSDIGYADTGYRTTYQSRAGYDAGSGLRRTASQAASSAFGTANLPVTETQSLNMRFLRKTPDTSIRHHNFADSPEAPRFYRHGCEAQIKPFAPFSSLHPEMRHTVTGRRITDHHNVSHSGIGRRIADYRTVSNPGIGRRIIGYHAAIRSGAGHDAGSGLRRKASQSPSMAHGALNLPATEIQSLTMRFLRKNPRDHSGTERNAALMQHYSSADTPEAPQIYRFDTEGLIKPFTPFAILPPSIGHVIRTTGHPDKERAAGYHTTIHSGAGYDAGGEFHRTTSQAALTAFGAVNLPSSEKQNLKMRFLHKTHRSHSGTERDAAPIQSYSPTVSPEAPRIYRFDTEGLIRPFTPYAILPPSIGHAITDRRTTGLIRPFTPYAILPPSIGHAITDRRTTGLIRPFTPHAILPPSIEHAITDRRTTGLIRPFTPHAIPPPSIGHAITGRRTIGHSDKGRAAGYDAGGEFHRTENQAALTAFGTVNLPSDAAPIQSHSPTASPEAPRIHRFDTEGLIRPFTPHAILPPSIGHAITGRRTTGHPDKGRATGYHTTIHSGARYDAGSGIDRTASQTDSTISGTADQLAAKAFKIPNILNMQNISYIPGMVRPLGAGNAAENYKPGLITHDGAPQSPQDTGIANANMDYSQPGMIYRRRPGIIAARLLSSLLGNAIGPTQRETAQGTQNALSTQSTQNALGISVPDIGIRRDAYRSLYYHENTHGTDAGIQSSAAASMRPPQSQTKTGAPIEHKSVNFKKVDMSVKRTPGMSDRDISMDPVQINRLVNQVYEQLEKKMFHERRRMGL